MDTRKIGAAVAKVGEALEGLTAEEVTATLKAAIAAYGPPPKPIDSIFDGPRKLGGSTAR